MTRCLLLVVLVQPPVTPADRLTFPSLDEARRQVELYQQYLPLLEARREAAPYWDRQAYNWWIAESIRHLAGWELLRAARYGLECGEPDLHWCLLHLEALRRWLGEEAYYAGRMPPAWPPRYSHPSPEGIMPRVD